MPRSLRRALLLVTGLGVAGCGWWYNDVPSPDDLMYAIPWFDHMLGSMAVSPYETGSLPHTPPPGSVPVTGAEIDWFDEWRVLNTTTADALVNPVGRTDGLARGEELYDTFCALCHGPTGQGDGLVGRKLGAPSLMTPRAAGFSDGYLYSIVRYGRGIMAPYGDKIFRQEDRWRVVNYLRTLTADQPGGGD